jgi:hypothetical protein
LGGGELDFVAETLTKMHLQDLPSPSLQDWWSSTKVIIDTGRSHFIFAVAASCTIINVVSLGISNVVFLFIFCMQMASCGIDDVQYTKVIHQMIPMPPGALCWLSCSLE